ASSWSTPRQQVCLLSTCWRGVLFLFPAPIIFFVKSPPPCVILSIEGFRMAMDEPTQTTTLLCRLRSGHRDALAAQLDHYRPRLGAQCRAVQRAVPLPAESSALLTKALLAQGPSPSQALLQQELRARLQHALEQLDPADREVILMRHYEDMSNGEVAQALGLS